MKALIDFGKRMVDIVQVNINEDNVVRLRVKYYDARDGGFIANRWVDLKEIEITPAIARAIADKSGLPDARAQDLADQILGGLKDLACKLNQFDAEQMNEERGRDNDH